MSTTNRRKFLTNTALSASSLLLSGSLLSFSSKDQSDDFLNEERVNQYNLLQEVKKYRKIDAHVHVDLANNDLEKQKQFANVLLDFCDRMHVDKLILSKPVTRLIKGIPDGSPEAFIEHNNIVLAIVKQYPEKFMGSFTFNPVHKRQSLEEIDRCVDQGLVNAKVYYQTKINDPSYYPIIEKMIDLKMIIHMHAEAQIGVGGYRMKYNGNKPANVSIPEDFVDIAKRYPEAIFHYAHIGGGGDWEYMCKALKNSANVYVDTSGSNNAENMIDFAMQELGEDRLFFGSDNCYYQSVGKILASNLTEAQKKKIFFDNYNNILRKGGRNVD